MVRKIMATMFTAAALVAVGGTPSYAEEACVEAAVTQNGTPLAGTDEKCAPTPFTTNGFGDCVSSNTLAVCYQAETP